MRLFALALILCTTSATAHPIPHVRALFNGTTLVKAEGSADIDTPFAIASVGKLFTSVSLLRLAQDGVLNLDDPAANWLPADVVQGFDGLDGVTLTHLATMTSGLPEYYWADFVDAVEDLPFEDQTPEFAASFAYDADRNFAPGQGYNYSNTNFLLLGMVLEAAAGQNYAGAVRSLLLEPLNLNDSFVFGSRPLPDAFTGGHIGWRHVRDYYETRGYGDGGMVSTAADLATLYAALLTDTILTDDYLQALKHSPSDQDYGMGLVVQKNFVGHSGSDLGFASNVIMDVDTGQIAIELIGKDGADADWPNQVFFD